MSTVAGGPRGPSRRFAPLFVGVVVVQVVAFLAVAPVKTFERFAPNAALADAVRSAGLQHPLVSGDDFVATSVGAYLDQPTYSVVRHAWSRYFIHDDREARRFGRLDRTEILCTARRIARRAHHPAGVLVDRPLPRMPGVDPVVVIDQVHLERVDPGAVIPGCAAGSGG